MDELTREYTLLFNGITDTIQQLEGLVLQLKLLQKKAELEYVTRQAAGFEGFPEGENVVVLDPESFSVMQGKRMKESGILTKR